MTENEYLKFPWSVENTIENLKEIKEIMVAKVRAVNLDGRAESDAKEVSFDFDRAISALEEIQQYREIGTVEECREAVEKQKAKKPIRIDMCTCPNCGTYNETIKKRRKTVNKDIVYCWHCGQAMLIRRVN